MYVYHYISIVYIYLFINNIKYIHAHILYLINNFFKYMTCIYRSVYALSIINNTIL